MRRVAGTVVPRLTKSGTANAAAARSAASDRMRVGNTLRLARDLPERDDELADRELRLDLQRQPPDIVGDPDGQPARRRGILRAGDDGDDHVGVDGAERRP